MNTQHTHEPVPVYCYDDTGRYTSWEYADPDPLEPGKYLLPPNATLTPPPDWSKGEVARWDGERWAVEPDNTEVQRHAAFQRLRRNYLLSASDWTQLPDTPLTAEEVIAWRRYRELLRALPNAEGWPYVQFPAEPGKEVVTV